MEKCPVCASEVGINVLAKEMMFGTGRTYRYRECAECETLYYIGSTDGTFEQPMYSNDYYSFAAPVDSTGVVRNIINRKRAEWLLWQRSAVGRALNRRRPLWLPKWLLECGLCSFHSRILDVGCGSGSLLIFLQSLGFCDLTGTDPFLKSTTNMRRIKLFSATLDQMNGEYDCVMFHHSLEHLSDPIEALKMAAALLSKDGRIVVRVPVKDSFAWEKYKTEWVQLDAPRHQVLFTRSSLERICVDSGLSVLKQFDDSTSFQFWGSEQYLRGIALQSPESYAVSHMNSVFSEGEIAEFQGMAEKLNLEFRGDQTVFILQKAKP